jgi:hypothetical protein
MLHEFLTANRHDLIGRCAREASKRDLPLAVSSELEHGVPLFLAQLVAALRCDEANLGPKSNASSDFPEAAFAESRRTAALHGKALLERGYSVAQVVHGYGDVCQAITELAKEKNSPIGIEEFHTLNRLLDNAIADAVASYGQHRDSAGARGAQDMNQRMGTLAQEQRDLLDTSLRTIDALKAGNIGVNGATGALLEDNLMRLRDLIDRSLPEIRLSSGMTSAPRPVSAR